MDGILNITNGDSTVALMREAGIEGEYLPWRDVLHDGPVPGRCSLAELSAIRAEFIARCGWGTKAEIHAGFISRDGTLARARNDDRIVLWFEHDLYDQLQILQILDYLGRQPIPRSRLSMICSDSYLGMLTPMQLADLQALQQPLTEEQLELATRAWQAFRAVTPEAWSALLSEDLDALPFLRAAVIRQLEEYPACSNGLSRTEQQALELVESGTRHPGQLFAANQRLEEAIFMGDASFFLILNQLLRANPPLLKLNTGRTISFPLDPAQTLALTPLGLDILRGKAHRQRHLPVDRWIGGVRLTPENLWCWDRQTRTLGKQRVRQADPSELHE